MEVYGEFLVISTDYRKNITFLSINNVKNSWTFEVDWNFKLNDAKPKMFLESGNEENAKTKDSENQEEELVIHNIAVSCAGNFLAFTASDKTLFLCKIDGSSIVVLSRRLFLRTSSQLKFSSCGKRLFLSDKTGDTFEFSSEMVDQPGRWIFGHISQILDLKVKPDMSYIVTSDRDEKIRVTKYPDTHEIEAFCVGHKEYVSSVTFFNDDRLLLSASGDKTLRLWNFKTGKQVHQIELEFVPVTVTLSTHDLLAVSSDYNTLYIYNYKITSPDTFTIHLIAQKTYTSEFDFVGGDDAVYIKYLEEDDGVKKLKVDKVSSTASFELLRDVTEAMEVKLEPSFKIFRPFDISLLFKKKFDNVKQYIDRKRARIENQESKKKKVV